MYLMLVPSRVLRFGPPFRVCTPLSVRSPFCLFQNDLSLTASKYYLENFYGLEIFTQILHMFLMLVPSRVLRFDPPFSVCTPLYVCSPFWLSQVLQV